jgi:hypothetical protein
MKHVETLNTTALLVLLAFAGCSPVAPEPLEVLTNSGERAWSIINRIENDGSPGLPACAKDDTLIFRKDGSFDSLIAGTQCNPSETEVRGGSFALSTDKKVITFAVPGFSYTGTLIEISKDRLLIQFDLGPGFVVRDTFVPRI